MNTFTGEYNQDNGDTPNQVTARKDYVVELTADRSKNLYALAVVNGTGVVEAGATENSVKIKGGADQTGITLNDLYAQVAANPTSPNSQANLAGDFVHSDNTIFMTNAVLSDKQGGQVIPTGAATYTLATIDKTKIVTSQTAASNPEQEPAVEIYVERGVAKVTISNTNTTLTTAATGGVTVADGTAFSATLAGWCLDNTNKSSFIVRNVGALNTNLPGWMQLVSDGLANNRTTDKYRFVGNTPVDPNQGYRTYWCTDPNYNVDYSAANFFAPDTKDFVTTFGSDNPLYCFENTFDVAHQIVKNTTRAIIKVTLNGGDDFYTINGDRKTIYPLNELKKQVVNLLFTNSDFSDHYAAKGLPADNANNLTKIYNQITIQFNYGRKSDGSAGLVTVDNITIPKAAYNPAASEPVTEDYPVPDGIIATINNGLGNVRYYKEGVAYYAIRIQHFGNDLTPWDKGESATAPEERVENGVVPVDAIYPGSEADQNKNYLGRYGMVRNNWYELTLGSILKIGKPVIPGISGKSDPDEPDDPTDPDNPDHPDDSKDDAYIKARINVLSWAKRPQSWDLK